MGNLLRNRTKGNTSLQRAGFTLIEVLVALAVMGVATTVLFSMLLKSTSLSKTNKKNAIAAHIAQEYMTELRVHPELFTWPEAKVDKLNDIIGITKTKDDRHMYATRSNAKATTEKAFDRDEAIYENYSMLAYTRLNDEQDNYLEVMVEVYWNDGGKLKKFCLTSSMPRSIGEGVGL